MKTLIRIANALESIANLLTYRVIRVKDVDRAKVYTEHLGRKLMPDVRGNEQDKALKPDPQVGFGLRNGQFCPCCGKRY